MGGSVFIKNSILVIVPCGISKIWKKHNELKSVKASEAYIGPPFKLNKAFAKKFADKWLILSAKYGFIEPDFIIPEDYDVSFNKPKTNSISLSELEQQFEKSDWKNYSSVIAPSGENYTRMVKAVFASSAKVVALGS